MKTEDESWQEAKQMEQAFATQIELEQTALSVVDDAIFDRPNELRKRLAPMTPFQAAAVAVIAVEILESSSFDRHRQVARLKRMLREGA